MIFESGISMKILGPYNGILPIVSPEAGAWSMALLLLSALEKLPARRDAVHFGLRIACEARRYLMGRWRYGI